MRYFKILMLLLVFSCNNEKIVQLPEITHSDFNKILDVSHAYLFYDETKTDSIELNRKNLISTTNWLINVDKRLTLKQVLPKILFLQDKKRNAEIHKNEDAKNFYTCHNTSITNLGFIEFTDVYYKEKHPNDFIIDEENYGIIFNTIFDIKIIRHDYQVLETSETKILEDIKSVFSENSKPKTLHLFFNKSLTFQDYITLKSLLNTLKIQNVIIANEEFVFN